MYESERILTEAGLHAVVPGQFPTNVDGHLLRHLGEAVAHISQNKDLGARARYEPARKKSRIVPSRPNAGSKVYRAASKEWLEGGRVISHG